MKIKKHSIGVFIALMLFLVLSITSGYRNGGYDYDNYIEMIALAQSGESLIAKMLLAKDPAFGLIVGLTNPGDIQDYSAVFFSIALLAFFCKFFFIRDVHRCVLFAVLYLFLFAPGLDFAAIRALLGIMFLLAASSSLSRKNVKLFYLFSFLSLLSHISMLLPLALSASFLKNIYAKNKVLVCGLFFSFSVFMKPLFGLFGNTAAYIEVAGSIFAFSPILLTLISLLILGSIIGGEKQTEFCERAYTTAILLVCMSLGFAFQVVVAASRFLQIAQVLILIVICTIKFKKSSNKLALFIMSIFLYLIPILYQNFDYDLWRSAWLSVSF